MESSYTLYSLAHIIFPGVTVGWTFRDEDEIRPSAGEVA